MGPRSVAQSNNPFAKTTPPSPTITHASSTRTISPAPSGARRRSSGQSKPASRVTAPSSRRTEDSHQRPSRQAAKFTVASQPAPHDLATVEETAPPRAIERPVLLPNDVSQYLQDSEPLDTAVVTLSQFAHVVKLQSHAERKATECRTRLHRALVLDGLTLRLLRCGESTRNTLFDYCRQEDRTATVQLAARFRELKDQTTAVRSILSQETPAVSDSRLLNISLRGDSASFLDGLPDESRSVFLEFLTTIRTKPGFLADRICDLPQDLLIDLVKHHEIPLPTESILSYQPQKPRPSRKTPSADGPENGGIDRLNDFSRHDPLSLLLHTVFLTGARQGTTEARLRTDVWAEVCAKLFIEGRGEKVIYAALDSWAAARPWSARANLELYMMKMIKRGTFLLDSKQSSIAMTQNPYNRKQDIMKEEFIDEGVEGLFDVLDDQPDASGIPEGAIELGHAIIDKLQDPTRKKAATVLILGKWFFNRFLTSILMYPERHGLLLNHYLPEFARLRIFRDIIVKVSKDVTTVLQRLKQPSPVLPKLRVKIESLVLRFRDSRDPVHHGNVKEIGPSSLPRTTKETNSFLLLSPTDLVILVRTLYPTPARSETSSSPPVDIPIRPRGAAPMGSTSSPPASSRNSPDSPPSPLTASIFTVRSDETGNESLVTSHLDRVVSGHGATRPASLYPHHEQRDSLPTRLGQAVDHLSSLLRERVGTYHPHALDDLWTVVHVSKQGMKLSTRMKGYTGASDESEGVSDSEMDDQDSPVNFLPHRKYHRLKRTVTELVKAYEITPSTGDRTPPEEYSSNLARLKQSNFQLETVTVRSKSSQGSSNPYHKSSTTSDTAGNHPRSRQNPTRQNSAKSTLKSMQPGNSLTQMLNFAKQQCLARGEFGLAHRYNDGIEQLQALPTSLRRDDFSPLLTVFVRGGKEASIAAHNSMEEHDASFFWLEQSQQQQEAMIDEISHVIDCLRLKLWYDIEVRNSEPYATFKNVAIAMRTMGQWLSTDSTNPAWGWSEKAFRATMDKMSDIEREVFELMAAPAEEGGPTKLANDQVDMVKTWLHQQDIWNACPAEERLHRFCLAIVRFQHRIIGDKRNNWSYLRSSATYRQEITQVAADSRLEEKELDMRSAGLPERQMGVNSDVKDKGSEDWDTLTSAASSRPDGPRNAQENPIAPRGPNRNPSFVSDKSKVSSPPATGRSSMSAPMTSSDAVQVKPQEQPRARKSGAQIEPAPPAFIRNLSEGLISLLLSELGPIAFESGSETDSWLTCQYSEECFGRLLERQRKNQEQVHGQKSLTLLHKAYLSKAREGVSSRPKQTDRQLPLEHAAPQYRPDPRLESFARRSTSPVQEQPQHLRMGLSARRSALFDFPYNLAFTRLFAKFATHPSPFVKLHTLYEIHQLIIARLKSQNSRSDMDSDSDTQGRRSRKGSCSRSSEAGVRRKTAAGAPHTKAKSHRGSVRSEKQGSTGNGSNEDAYSEYAGSEDDVHSSLYDLLKSADMRPATFYRDLQYIASIVPRYILDRSARGDTFWVFAKVALMLKTDICLTMVEISTELLSFYLERQRADKAASSMSETASVAESVSAISLAASDLASHYSIIDVANMWVITAMEGNTLGQRELALMYIRFPEVMPTVTPPLTRAGDIITPAILASRKANAATNRSSNERNGHDLEMKREAHKHDPVPMALALAWTILSAEGGDAVAKHYVRQRKGGIVGNLRLAVEV